MDEDELDSFHVISSHLVFGDGGCRVECTLTAPLWESLGEHWGDRRGDGWGDSLGGDPPEAGDAIAMLALWVTGLRGTRLSKRLTHFFCSSVELASSSSSFAVDMS